jgi:hypothetical protein
MLFEKIFEKIKKIPTLYILTGLFLLHICIGWPGILSSDSWGQYAAAVSGVYGDHHPAIMSFVWRYLDRIYEGSGLLWLLHLSFLYGGFYKIIKVFPYKKWIPFLIIFPHMFLYSLMVWKDVGFSYGYVFCISLLVHAYSEKRSFKFFEHLLFFLVLFYSTTIKFQGQFLSPLMLFYYGFVHWPFLHGIPKIGRFFLLGCGVFATFFSLVSLVNDSLVPHKQKNHSWQFVKIYDIAGVAYVKKDTSLLPDFIKTSHYSDEAFYKTFNHQRVDDVVFFKNPLFIIFKEEEMQKKLYDHWYEIIIENPFSYFNHRVKNLGYALLSPMGFMHIEKYFHKTFPQSMEKQEGLWFGMYQLAQALSYLVLGHIGVLFFALFAFMYGVFISVYYPHLRKHAMPCIAMNALGLFMCGVLLFKSMAGAPRYTYFMVCQAYLSWPFVTQIMSLRKKIKQAL